jgi:Cu/Ag efflux protein CusF
MKIRGHWGVAAATVTVAVLCGTCGKSAENGAATKPRVEVTELRGVIEKMPTPDKPQTLTIRHEATKDMESMAMPFTVAEGVPLTGLAVGNKVAFREELNLTARTDLVTKIEKLPADTTLKLGDMTMPGTMGMPPR